MQWGYYWDYPETYLTDQDKEALLATPFFKTRDLEGCAN